MDENGGLRFLPNTMATFHNGSRIDVFQKAAKYTLQKVKNQFDLVFLLSHFFRFKSKYFLQGYNCCSDSLIAVHYMYPRDVIRLDIAFEILEFASSLYKKYNIDLKKTTFVDIFDTYNLLDNMESRSKP